MILRKPYAFLIKHFRLFHLVLFCIFGYLLIAMNDIRSFYSHVVSNNLTTYADSTDYLNPLLFYVPILGFVVAFIIFWLLKEKNKPFLTYLWICLFSIVYIISYAYLSNNLNDLAVSSIDLSVNRFCRDLSVAVVIVSLAISVICLLRGLGFDIKRFEFNRDLKDLQIAEDDSSEYEVMIGQNSYIYVRNMRRIIRELKYYAIENTFSLVLIAVFVVIVIGFSSIKYYNDNYKIVDSTSKTVDNILYQINSGYITSYDYKGEKISTTGQNTYIVLDMTFTNVSSNQDATIDTDKIFLNSDNLFFGVNQSNNSKFYDLGSSYVSDTIIKPGTSVNHILWFEVPASFSQQTKKFVLKVRTSVGIKNDILYATYANLDAPATNIDMERDSSSYHTNEVDDQHVYSFESKDKRNDFTFQIDEVAYLGQASDLRSIYYRCKTVDECGDPLSDKIDANGKKVLRVRYSVNYNNDSKLLKHFSYDFAELFSSGVLELKTGTDDVKNITVYTDRYSSNYFYLIVDEDAVYATNSKTGNNIYLYFHFRNVTQQLKIDVKQASDFT